MCLANNSVFNAMFQSRHKHKDDAEKFSDIVENPSSILNRQLKRNEKLTKLILEKYVIQKKIDALLEDLFFVK